MTDDLQNFLYARQDVLTKKFESGNVDAILEHYHQDVDFSDHAWQADHLTYTQLKEFLSQTFETTESPRMVTHGVHGTKEFSVWEWTLKIVSGISDPIRGIEKGKEKSLRGCSLHWWRKVEGMSGEGVGDWKIWREGDYAGEVPVGE